MKVTLNSLSQVAEGSISGRVSQIVQNKKEKLETKESS